MTLNETNIIRNATAGGQNNNTFEMPNKRANFITECCKITADDCWHKKCDYIALFLLFFLTVMMIGQVILQTGSFKQWQETCIDERNRAHNSSSTLQHDIAELINKTMKKSFKQWKQDALDLILSDYLNSQKKWPRPGLPEPTAPITTSTTTTTMTSTTTRMTKTLKSTKIPKKYPNTTTTTTTITKIHDDGDDDDDDTETTTLEENYSY